MPNLTAVDIEKLCDDWCATVINPNGGMSFGSESEKFRLRANGVLFHELNQEALAAALCGLSKVLLLPNFSIIIDEDHIGLWSWCGQLLLGPRPQGRTEEQRELNSLYEVCIHASLANFPKPSDTEEEWLEQRRIWELQPHHGKQLLEKSDIALAYLAFPLLESVLKQACETYVALDGRVLSAFSIPGKNGTLRNYTPNGAYRDRKCSSLRDLLFLHYTVVASPQLKKLIDRFRTHITSLDPTQDPFDLIYNWRNESLHGTTNFYTIGGTILNLSILISLFNIDLEFEELRLQTIDACNWAAQTPHKKPWRFYPPY